MSKGRYYRNIFDERKRYEGALLQRSETGRPTYLVDADFRDQNDILQRVHQRLGQTIHPSGAFVQDSFKLLPETTVGYEDDNFRISGSRDLSVPEVVGGETHAAGYVGGHRVTCWQSTDFNCVADGGGTFDTSRADAIHRKYTSITATTIVDTRANWQVNALVGETVRLFDGDHAITSNTAQQITVATINTAAEPTADGDRYYFVKLPTEPIGTGSTRSVYLDVHLEDWGADEDPMLNHNPGGSTLEAMRRYKLVQQVFIDFDPIAHSQPITDHTDAGGVQHYVVKLGDIARASSGAPAPVLDSDITDGRDANAGVGPEVADARVFTSRCGVADAPSLAEKMSREASWVTVGPLSPAVAAGRGVYEGFSGLIAALACTSPNVIYLKAGTYTATSDIGIPAGWRIYAEDGAIIDLGSAYSVTLAARSSFYGGSITSADNPSSPILVQGDGVTLERVTITAAATIDRITALISVAPAYGAQGGRIANCILNASSRPAIGLNRTPGGYPSAVSSIAGFTVEGNTITAATVGLPDALGAISIYGGVHAIVRGNYVQATTLRCLLVDGAGETALATSLPGSRDNTLVEGNYFVRTVNDAGVAIGASVYVSQANVTLANNQVEIEKDTAAVGALDLPAYGIQVLDAASLYGRVDVVGNFVRGGSIGISVTGTLSYAECFVRNNIVHGYDSSMSTGIHAKGASVESQILLDSNIVTMQAPAGQAFFLAQFAHATQCVALGATTGFYVLGDAIAHGEVALESCAAQNCTKGVEITADMTSTRVANCAITGGSTGIEVGGGAVLIADCIITDASTYGIDVTKADETDGTVTISGCLVAGSTTTGMRTLGKVAGCTLDIGLTGVLPVVAVGKLAITNSRVVGFASFGVSFGAGVPVTLRGCDFQTVATGVAASEGVSATDCTFSSASDVLGLSGGDYRDCTVKIRNMAGTVLPSSGDISLTNCRFIPDGAASFVAQVVSATGGDVAIKGCAFGAHSGNVISVVGGNTVDIDDNTFNSVRDLKGSFSKTARAIYVDADFAADRVSISRNNIFGDGISLDGGTAHVGARRVAGNTISNGVGIWVGTSNVEVSDNDIDISTGVVTDALSATGIYYGHELVAVADAADRATVLATIGNWNRARILNNHIRRCGNIGSDLTVNVNTGRSAGIVCVINDNLIQGNTIETGGIAILIGNINDAVTFAAQWRVGVTRGCIVKGNTIIGIGPLVIVDETGGTTHLVEGNSWGGTALQASPPTLVYVFSELFSAAAGGGIGTPDDNPFKIAVVRFRNNEVAFRISGAYSIGLTGHTAAYWGVIRTSEVRNIDNDDGGGGVIAIEPRRVRQVGLSADQLKITGMKNDAAGEKFQDLTGTAYAMDLLPILNNFVVGADLD